MKRLAQTGSCCCGDRSKRARLDRVRREVSFFADTKASTQHEYRLPRDREASVQFRNGIGPQHRSKNAIKDHWTNNAVLITVIALATILAFIGHVAAGRLVGLSITVLCGVSMAFFLMPPTFSLRVSQTHDIVALAFYGTAGLVFAKSTPKNKRAAARIDPIRDLGGRKGEGSDLATAAADLISSDLGASLGAIDLYATAGDFILPCTHDATLRILADILTAALQTPEVRRVSIFGAQQPSIYRLIVVAHGVWPPPLFEVITIGKRDEDCESLRFPGWPTNSRASWFHNGHDHIYQVSLNVIG